MATYKTMFNSILKRENVHDNKLPYVEFAGYGQLATGFASVIENFLNRINDHAEITDRMIDEALGVFRQRFLESLSP